MEMSRLRAKGPWGIQDITHTALGANQGNIEGAVNLRPQAADVRFYDRRFGIKTEIPDALEKHGAGHQPAAIAHQHFEQLEFTRVELDRLVATPYLPGDHIHNQVVN